MLRLRTRPPAPDAPPLDPARDLLLERLRAAVARRALLALAALAAATLWWLVVDHASVEGLSFLAFAIAATWAYAWGRRWWTLRGGLPAAPDAAERQAVEYAAWWHASRLAARPARLTWALLAAIALPTALELAQPEWLERAGLLKHAGPPGQWWRVLTSSYLHGGVLHFAMNALALRAVGSLMEAYVPRLRLPLVYLAAVVTAGLASAWLLPDVPSVGASGGIMGLVGFLAVLALRRRSEVPASVRSAMLSTIVLTGIAGALGFAVIDNAAHAGGTLAGALLALVMVPREGRAAPVGPGRPLDALGLLAMCVLVAGALLTAVRLLAPA